MHLDKFFAQHPVFHYKELVSYLEQVKEYNPNSLKALLQYHLAKEHLSRVRRGYYAVNSMLKSSSKIADDPILIAGKITGDAVLSHHTALTFHALAYSLSSVAYFCSQLPIRPFQFMNITYRRVTHPKYLLPKDRFFETKNYDRQGLDIRVTTIERTLIDCLDKPQLAGGWEEIWHAAEMVSFLDIERMTSYALRLGNVTTIAKTGFFLEQHQVQFSVEEQQLKVLEKNTPKSVHYMSSSRSEQGHYLKRWRLIVPASVINKTWEEPQNDFI